MGDNYTSTAMPAGEGFLLHGYPSTGADVQDQTYSLNNDYGLVDEGDADTFMDAYHDAFMSEDFHSVEDSSNIQWGDDADNLSDTDNDALSEQFGHTSLEDDHDVQMKDPSGESMSTDQVKQTDAESGLVQSCSFRFLDLSGELRNRVYEFCAADDYGKPGHTYHFNLLDKPFPHVERRIFQLHIVKSHFMSLTHVNKQIRNEFLPIFQNLMVSRPPNESQDLIHAVPATAPSCGSGSRSSRFSHLIVYLRLYGFEVYRKTFVLSPRTPPQHSLIVLDLDYGEIGHLIDAHELLTLCDKYPGLIMASTGHSPTLRAYFKFPFHGTYYTITASETSTIFNNMFRQSSVILKNKTLMNGLKSISFQGWRHGMGLWIEYNNVPNDLAIIVEKCRLWWKVLVGPEIPCVGLPELE